MNEIVSFSKEIEFNNMLNKITSISIEHTLTASDSSVKGDLIVSGSYIQTIASQVETPFSYRIPVDIEIDPKYDLSSLVVDIDDFTYDVIDEKILKINVDLLLDKLKLKQNKEEIETLDDDLISVDDLFLEKDDAKKLDIPVSKDEKKEIDDINENLKTAEENCSTNDLKEEPKNESLFSNLSSNNETYSTYSIYIVGEDDSLEKILDKYKISRSQLEEYNDLSNFSKGTKLIIPSINE